MDGCEILFKNRRLRQDSFGWQHQGFKSCQQIEAYETMGALNNWLGNLTACCDDRKSFFIEEVQEIQQCLFDAGHDLACAPNHSDCIFPIIK
ncbi:ATP:cob(I)alamin adenosyltransferase [Sporolactobacillus sp. Y61]|uniref:ATP:cob(I)alamin adenosyltransferase n=1 Tax=Sporolactobacillus sp. Y61 TaxID=3160863 RepID=A0AAU8II80_9BACL